MSKGLWYESCSFIAMRSDQDDSGHTWWFWKVPRTTLFSVWLLSFFCMFVLNLSLFYTCGLLSSHHVPLLWTWLCLPDDLPDVGIGRMLSCPPEDIFSPVHTRPGPSLPCQRASALSPLTCGLSLSSCQFINLFVFCEA